VTKVIISVVTAGLFLIPASIFLALDMTSTSMLLITAVFTVFFGILISVREMRRKEVSAFAIVYCAVLLMLLFGSLQMRQLPPSESVGAASRL
jgi:formate hydrogenlyase subunit 3/multisubunit Na+/H+ antiporter MnhD subunit